MAALALRLELTPPELLRRLPPRSGRFLLDGGAPNSWGCGEAILGWEASEILRLSSLAKASEDMDPFRRLEELATAQPCAGVVAALGYDLRHCIERLAPGPRDDHPLPLLFAAAHPWVLAYSYADRRYELRSPILSQVELEKVRDWIVERAASQPDSGGACLRRAQRPAEVRSNFTRPDYIAAVRRVLEYIAAGDVYQVNLSQRFTAPHDEAPADLFARLLAWHPAPWAAFVDAGDFALVSISPECFLQRRGASVSTWPIKGTRPRRSEGADDNAMAAHLRSSVKDGAEHLMIVDLERNDLGRVCRYGSVGVRRFAEVLPLESLLHLESEIAGELREGASLASLLRATFPGGSITGAPKIRAMQIIDELEPAARGFYTGSIGFIEADGSARFNIAIRTATATRGELSYHAGGGIVADSDPVEEYEETLLKARAFLETLNPETR